MAKTQSPTENAFGRQSPIRDAFIKRSAHVIERLAERADEATLADYLVIDYNNHQSGPGPPRVRPRQHQRSRRRQVTSAAGPGSG